MSRKLLAITLLAAACILGVVFGMEDTRPLQARSVSAFATHPQRERLIRIAGVLVHGSLCRQIAPCNYHFRMSDGSALGAKDAWPGAAPGELSVDYRQCIVPEQFREAPGFELQVTVEGRQCATCPTFDASQIFTKTSTPYFVNPDGGLSRRILPETPLCNAQQ